MSINSIFDNWMFPLVTPIQNHFMSMKNSANKKKYFKNYLKVIIFVSNYKLKININAARNFSHFYISKCSQKSPMLLMNKKNIKFRKFLDSQKNNFRKAKFNHFYKNSF